MRDDADNDIALTRQALALLDRCARQRAEPFYRHGLLGELKDGVVGYPAVGDESTAVEERKTVIGKRSVRMAYSRD